MQGQFTVLVLDDVGTKAQEPKLEPDVETGNVAGKLSDRYAISCTDDLCGVPTAV